MTKKIIISQKLFKEIIRDIEDHKNLIDSEFGQCRDIKQIIKDGDMPELWYKLKSLLSK
jgi:hypothetical protein